MKRTQQLHACVFLVRDFPLPGWHMRAKMRDPFFAAPRTVPIYVYFATTELVEHLAAAWAAFVIQKSANETEFQNVVSIEYLPCFLHNCHTPSFRMALFYHPRLKFTIIPLHKGLILLKGLPGEARVLLESIQDPQGQTDSLLPLADACLESGDATAAILLLKGSFNLDPLGREDLGRAESLLRAEAAAGADDSVGPALEAAIERHPDDPALFILAAVRSSLQNDIETSVAALTKAIDLTDGPHHSVFQTELGRLYARRERFVDAAEQFGQAWGDDASHPAAVPMLLALFNSRQYRKALDLARKIREVDGPTPRVVIDIEADIFGYVGDARSALLRHCELCAREDSTPDDRVRLALAQFRSGERDAALETILELHASELGHDSQALMKLAHMKRFLGATDYLDDAYLARRYGLSDPDAHLGYFILFQGRDKEWEDPEIVGPGCAISIKSDEGEQWWQIIEMGEERYGTRDLSPEDDLAQRLQ